MKNLIPFSFFALTAISLSSCASISNVADDNVYVLKGSEIPIGESLDDETSYTAYKYKKERNNNSVRYQGNNSFVQPPFFMTMGYNNGYYGYNPYRYNPYGFYDPYAPMGHHGSQWGYMPGYGWSYMGGNSFSGGYGGYYGNPYGYGYPYNYGYYGNPYGYGYGSGSYGNPYGYGYNNYGYGNYYGNNGFYGNNGYSGNGGNWDNNSYSNPNHHSGPRGTSSGGGVRTVNNRPGTVKMGTTTPVSPNPVMRPATAAASNRVSRPVGNDKITSRPSTPISSSSENIRQPATRVDDGSLNRPGRVQTASPANPSRTNASGTNPNSGNGRTLNSGSSSPVRNPSSNSPARTSSPNQNASPSRNSGNSSPATTSPSRGSSSGSGGSGGSTPRPSSGGRR